MVLLCMAIMTSCNRYIDGTHGGNSIEQGAVKFYTDSNVFTYKTNIIVTRDTEKIYPKFFEVALPKKMKYYEFISSTDFAFYYDKGQTIFIKIALEPETMAEDTTYNPSPENLEEFVQTALKTNGGTYDIKRIPVHKNRKNAIIKKGVATMLLYNVLNDNYEQFFDKVSRFRFIN